MTTGFVSILFFCFSIQNVISESPEEQLQALKKKFVNQPDCTPLFEIRHPGYITPNAPAYPSIKTEDECKSSCIKDEYCMSYQIDSRRGKAFCRLQSSYQIENFDGPFDETEVKEYVFTVKCVNTTAKGQCAPLIEVRFRNWNTHRAGEQQVKSELECRTRCLNDKDCLSYQIDSKSSYPSCFIQKHPEMLELQKMYMGQEVTEYFVVDRCLDKYEVSTNKGCSPVFKKLHEDVSKMATSFPLVTTEQSCRLTCLFKPDCVSYQINRTPGAPFCLIQTKGENLKEGKRSKIDMVTEYILVDSCTDTPLEKTDPDCKPYVIPKPYLAVSWDAEPHAEVTNYEDCQLLCVATPTCVAFQNTSYGNERCWIQKSWMKLLPNEGYFNAFAREYVVVRKCLKGPTTPQSIPSSGDGPISSTTVQPSQETLLNQISPD